MSEPLSVEAKSLETVNNLVVFLSRVNLSGAEVGAFNQAMGFVQGIKAAVEKTIEEGKANGASETAPKA